jgi:hypothetical protein
MYLEGVHDQHSVTFSTLGPFKDNVDLFGVADPDFSTPAQEPFMSRVNRSSSPAVF